MTARQHKAHACRGHHLLAKGDPHSGRYVAHGRLAFTLRPERVGGGCCLGNVEHRIQPELAHHDKMRKMPEAIQKNAEELGVELRKGSDKMNRLLGGPKETLNTLNVELVDTATDGAEGIALREGTLIRAREALTAA